MKKITLLCLSVLFSLTTLAQTDTSGAVLNTDGGTDYYIQFGRAGSGNQGVIQDMGPDLPVKTAQAAFTTDSQLWSVTIRSGKHVLTNKLGREIGWNDATGFYEAKAATAGVTFDIVASNNTDYPESFELQREGTTDHINQYNGGGFNRKLTEYLADDQGNPLKFIKETDAEDATIGVVGGLHTAAPSVLPELNTYYYIQFTPGKGVLDSNGSVVKTDYAHKDDDNQLWEITGTAGNYTITNKAGNALEYDGLANFTATAGGTTTYGLVENAPNWEIQRSGASGALNQSGGSGFGKTIAEWNVGDVNNVLTFVLPSDMVYAPIISDGVVADNYYRIKFLSSNNYIQDMGVGTNATLQALDLTNDGQLWKVTGSNDAMVLVSKLENTLNYDADNDVYDSTSSTTTVLELKVSQNDIYSAGWELQRVEEVRDYAMNQAGGGSIGALLSEWGIGDQNNPLIFTQETSIASIADTSGADLDTSGATDYYIQFGRSDNDGNQGVIQDMGLDIDLLTAQALEATDSQLWSITIRGDKHVFTNKLGREIGHSGSLLQATATDAGVIFDIIATANPSYPNSYELRRDGETQHVNQNGGGGFDRTLGQWTANDQGNPLKFIKVSDAKDATIGVVGGLLPAAALTSDDFEAYTAGSFDGQFQAGEWEGWGGPSNADVSTDYAVSGTNSLKVWDNAGTITDAVALLGPISTGSKTITMMQYIPSTGGGAYYHLMGDYIDGGAMHIEATLYFSTTVGEFSENGIVTTFTATPDTWVEQKFVLDYDNGVGQFYYGGTLVKEYVIAGSIDSIDFYATTISGAVNPSLAYYDDFLIAETVIPAPTRLTEDDFEAYTAGSFDGQFTAGEWEGWGGPSNADVSTDYAVSGTNSLKVWDNAGTLTDAVALLEPISSGSKTITMMQYIPSTGGGAYYHLMGDYIDGGAMHVEATLYFSTTVGELSENGVVTTFTATPDTWVEQKFVLDYENGVGQFYYGGTLVKEYVIAGSVDSIDFYATTISGAVNPSLAYYDDFLITETIPAIARLTEDDFEAYTAGSFDGQFTAGEWEGWGGPSNADVSTDYAVSGTNSLKVWDNAGTLTDAVALLEPISSGSKTITMMQYIPSTGGGAYYHLMGDYIDGGAMHVEATLYFSTTSGEFSANSIVTTFDAITDAWVEQKFVLNYDNGVGQFYYGRTLVKEYALAGSVDSIDFYATTISGAVNPSLAYYDDFLIAETTLSTVNDKLFTGAFEIYPNPTTGITNLKLEMDNADDVKVTVFNVLGKLLQSFNYTNVTNRTHSIDLSNQPNGIYFVRLTTNGQTETKKVIVNK